MIPEIQKTTGQATVICFFSAQVDLPRHQINIIEKNSVLKLLFVAFSEADQVNYAKMFVFIRKVRLESQ